MTPAVRAVALDYGGVLIGDAFVALAAWEAELGLSPGTLCEEFRGGPLFSQCEIGQLSIVEFFDGWGRRIREEYGFDPVPRVKEMFRASTAIKPEMASLVERLAGRYRLALVTNNIAESRDRWEGSLPPGCFDVLVDSSEVGLRKPDPKIYEILLDRLGLSAPEVVFVDDWEPNLQPARHLGMHAIRFTEAEALEAALAALGVDFGSRREA